MGEPGGPRGEGAKGVDLAATVGLLDAQRDGLRRVAVDALVSEVQPFSRAVDQLPEGLPFEGADGRRVVGALEQPGGQNRTPLGLPILSISPKWEL